MNHHRSNRTATTILLLSSLSTPGFSQPPIPPTPHTSPGKPSPDKVSVKTLPTKDEISEVVRLERDAAFRALLIERARITILSESPLADAATRKAIEARNSLNSKAGCTLDESMEKCATDDKNPEPKSK